MITCKNCGRQYEDQYRFCPGCGTTTAQNIVEYDGGNRICHNCGAPLDASNHCAYCGTKH